MEEKIIEVINDLKPYLNSEGGNIEFIKYDNGTVFVKLTGACSYCIYQDDTLKENLLKALQEKIPEVKEVINVEI